MNLHPIILGLMISVACGTGYSADVELTKLEKAFEKSLETESQAGIITAAGKISAHLNKQLIRLEEKIEKTEDKLEEKIQTIMKSIEDSVKKGPERASSKILRDRRFFHEFLTMVMVPH